MDNKILNKKDGHICINEEQDRFDEIIQRLPSLLKDGWKIPEMGAIDKNLLKAILCVNIVGMILQMFICIFYCIIRIRGEKIFI